MTPELRMAVPSTALLAGPVFSRAWGMPTGDTFDCPPIGDFVRRWMAGAKVSVDPFARNKRWATHTNDLNPATAAEHHMDAEAFLNMLADQGCEADLVLIDPPYSPRQVKECYDGIGLPMKQTDALLGMTRKRLKAALLRLVRPGGVCLHFGWNTVGMGKGWQIEEIVLVCHGSAHNDTICMAERRTTEQMELYPANVSRSG
jgi:hypothetical protein